MKSSTYIILISQLKIVTWVLYSSAIRFKIITFQVIEYRSCPKASAEQVCGCAKGKNKKRKKKLTKNKQTELLNQALTRSCNGRKSKPDINLQVQRTKQDLKKNQAHNLLGAKHVI